MNTVYFDLETGGLKWWPHEHNGVLIPMNPIIQIAAVAVDEDFKILGTFETKILFDEGEATEEALLVNHYSKELWQSHGIPPEDAIVKLNRFLKNYADIEKVSAKNRTYKVAQPAGHNAAGFDFPFLSAYYKLFGAFLPFDYHVHDTMVLARLYARLRGVKFPSLKLQTLAEYFKVEVINAHDALSDARTTYQIDRRMMQGLRNAIS